MLVASDSFIKRNIGENTYNDIKQKTRIWIPIASCILGIIILLSFFFHWEALSVIIDLTTGTSLLFIIYIIGLIILLNRDVYFVIKHTDARFDQYGRFELPNTKPKGYTKTVIIAVILIIAGILSIYYSNMYRKHYVFECKTFIVDYDNGIFHLDCDNGCEYANSSYHLEIMKGYQIDDNYTFCEWCEDWADEVEDDDEVDRYFRE